MAFLKRFKILQLLPLLCLANLQLAGGDAGDFHHIDYSFDGVTSALARGTFKPPQSESPSANQLPIWERNRTIADVLSRATNLHGIPVPSLTASQAIGTRGHILFQDFHLMDKLASFVRERIPERVVHAKGAGAHGYFVVTHDISKYTKAKFLNGKGKKTKTFVRFSTVGGEAGSADTIVDPHGFATKFYTEDGNHDLLCNTIEGFAVRDAILFPELIRSRKRNPVTNSRPDMNMWWDFVSLRPESTLQALHLHSDIGRPDGYRRTDGFAIHAFKLVNAKGQVVFAKFHWRTLQPAPPVPKERRAELTGTSPDHNTLDLYDAIARKDYPSWALFIQVMTIEQAKKYNRNPFDATRPWRKEEFPLIPVGTMTLNRNPSNYFAEVEQAGFQVSNMVPGVEPSPDKLLTGRLFAYQDAQRYRLGVNGPQIPINSPIVPVHSYNRNGLACHGPNGGGSPNYYPNSFGGTEPDSVGAEQVSFSVEGIVDRYDIQEDEYLESRLFLERDVDKAHRARLVDAIAIRLKDAMPEIRERVLKNNFYPVQKSFGDEVRAAVERHLAAAIKNQHQQQHHDHHQEHHQEEHHQEEHHEHGHQHHHDLDWHKK